MFDIHSHILFDILGDDGASTIDESIVMAKQLVESGFTHVVATPHYIYDQSNCHVDELSNKVNILNKAFKDYNIDLTVYEGHEVYAYEGIVDGLKSGRSLTMGGSDYVLIELPMYDIPLNFESVIFDMKLNGYKPILAHPERNKIICNDYKKIDKLLEMGVLLQLNIRSLSGFYGDSVKKASINLVKSQSYSFIGSDGHDMFRKSMCVKKELDTLKKITSEGYFLDLVMNNPNKMLYNRQVDILKCENSTKEHKLISIFKKFGGVLIGQD